MSAASRRLNRITRRSALGNDMTEDETFLLGEVTRLTGETRALRRRLCRVVDRISAKEREALQDMHTDDELLCARADGLACARKIAQKEAR